MYTVSWQDIISACSKIVLDDNFFYIYGSDAFFLWCKFFPLKCGAVLQWRKILAEKTGAVGKNLKGGACRGGAN